MTQQRMRRKHPVLVQLNTWLDSPDAGAFRLMDWLLGYMFDSGRDREPWEVLAIVLDRANAQTRKRLAKHLADLIEWQPDVSNLCDHQDWNDRLLHNVLGLARVLAPELVMAHPLTAMMQRSVRNPIFDRTWIELPHRNLLIEACERRSIKEVPSPVPDSEQIVRLVRGFTDWCEWRFSKEQKPLITIQDLRALKLKRFEEQCDRWNERWSSCPALYAQFMRARLHVS